MTLRAEQSKCVNLAQEISAQANVTVVVESAAADRLVTVSVIDRDYTEALEILARLVDSQLVIRDGVFYIGRPADSDKVVLVSRGRGASASEIQAACTMVAGTGRVQVQPDGTVVATGLPVEVERIAKVLRSLEEVQRSQWAIQFYLITMSERDLSDFGLTTNPALDLAVGQASGSAVGLDGVELRASLRTVLTAAEERSSVGITARPLLLLLDGGNATFSRGGSIAVPRRTISDQGTVTTVGFDSVPTGTTIDVAIRELDASTVRAQISIELSDLVELTVEGAPNLSRRRVSLPVSLADGGTYLLASLELDERRSNGGRWLRWGGLRDNSAEVLQVWATVARVQGSTPGENTRQETTAVVPVIAPEETPGEPITEPAGKSIIPAVQVPSWLRFPKGAK